MLIVLPVYNEAENVETLVRSLLIRLEEGGYRPSVFIVDDGSVDETLDILRKLGREHDNVHYVSFVKNEGKEVALMAGLRECGDNFDLLAYMDSDGQHQSDDLVRMLSVCVESRSDIVCGVRDSRNYQSRWQRSLSRAFYRLFHRLADTRIDEGAGDFNVMRPRVVAALRQFRESSPFVKGLVGSLGFKRVLVPIQISERASGTTKSSTYRRLKLGIGAVLSFSAWPLRVWSVIGACAAVIALVMLVIVLFRSILYGVDVPGYTSLVVFVLGIGGIQLISIGILGEYIGRVYEASKGRPAYLIVERSGDDAPAAPTAVE